MAITETRPDEAEVTATESEVTSQAGIVGVFGTADHRVVGRLWVGTSVLYLLLALVLAGLLGIERLDTGSLNLFDEGNFAQVFSLQYVAAFFLFLLPGLVGLATIVVPRQVGAATVAFPRAAAAAYWTYLLSGGLVVAAYAINGGPSGGKEIGVDLFLGALALEAAALILGLVCVATTVVALRPPGLSLDRAPAFAWSMLVAAGIWIASLGVLFGTLVLLYLDNRYDLNVFAQPNELDLWLRWVVTPPQVFAFAIPALGLAADVVPVFTGVRQRAHGVILGAIGGFGALSFGAWTFYAYRSLDSLNRPTLTKEVLYITVAFAALLPVLIVLGGVAEAFVRGRLRLAGPVLFAVGAVLMTAAAVAAGAIRVIEPFKLVGTTADLAVAELAFGAGVLAVLGGVHFWWPHSIGRSLNQLLGAATGVLVLVGTLAYATPDLISGFLDEGLASQGAQRDGVEALNGLSAIGVALILVGVLLFVVNVAVSFSNGDGAADVDPWNGHTLEWAADPSAVTVSSAAPLLDEREKQEENRERAD